MSKSKFPRTNSDTVIIETPRGALMGTQTGADREICVFKGIPYGVPPVGVRRWKPCEPSPGWTGIRLATEFAPQCPQPAVPPEQTIYYEHTPQTSEDCLYLNVWTPTPILNAAAESLPVMVWIHGGSLVNGAGSLPGYNGAELARKNVVLVTINYRLNIFGYFSHPALTAESPHRASGNYGTTDQIQALQWVRQNIAAFGGDPNNVTIFGESAGALSVSHLLASPLAKGLFHRAIMQSSYLPPIPTLQTAERKGSEFAKCVQRVVAKPTASDTSHLTEATLASLRALSADQLLRLAQDNGFYSNAANTEAVIDNWVFTEQIFECFEQGKQQDVPLLVGFNSGEAYAFADVEGMIAPEPESIERYIQEVTARYGKLATEYLEVYPPEDLREAVFAPVRDSLHTWASEKFAKMTGNVTSNAYLFCFDHVASWAEQAKLGAFHAAEVSYVFNNVKYHNDIRPPKWPEYTPSEADLNMADTISDYWVSFAKNGTPSVAGQPVWAPYTDDTRYYMRFKNGTPLLERNLLPGTFELHEKIVMQKRQRGIVSWLEDIGLLAPVIE